MSSEQALKANAAIENLEQNGKKLSEITAELSDLKEALEGLNTVISAADDTNRKSIDAIGSLNSAVDEVQEKLTAELKVRLAEGNAEHSSRLKDANEKLFALEAQIKLIESKVDKSEEANNNIKVKLSAIEDAIKSVNARHKSNTMFQVMLFLGIVFIVGKNLGLL